jgi:hypothetical protein
MHGDRCGRQGRSYDSAHAPSQIAAAATEPVDGAFLTAGIVLIIGIVAYVFILGRLEPIADPPATGCG